MAWLEVAAPPTLDDGEMADVGAEKTVAEVDAKLDEEDLDAPDAAEGVPLPTKGGVWGAEGTRGAVSPGGSVASGRVLRFG